MRIGLFGGSFDPVHVGHLWIAESARESLSLDEVRWIPAAHSPLKPSVPRASNEQRLQMLRLALSGASEHVVDDREIVRGDKSFTVETLESLRAEFPDNEWFLIIGSDSLATLDRWREPAKLLSWATVVVVQRGGESPIDLAILDRIAPGPHPVSMITVSAIEVSSSELRERIAAGRSIRYRTPRSVEALIGAERLYRDDRSSQ